MRERRLPGGYFPMRINRLLKRELRAKNLRYDGPLRPADEMAKHRPVPVKRLISKLGLDPRYQEAPLTAVEPEVACVTLPLRQHIGISAVPCVAPGERVTRGRCWRISPPTPSARRCTPVLTARSPPSRSRPLRL